MVGTRPREDLYALLRLRFADPTGQDEAAQGWGVRVLGSCIPPSAQAKPRKIGHPADVVVFTAESRVSSYPHPSSYIDEHDGQGWARLDPRYRGIEKHAMSLQTLRGWDAARDLIFGCG